jgi:Flp pilus assembly secretin CpaC
MIVVFRGVLIAAALVAAGFAPAARAQEDLPAELPPAPEAALTEPDVFPSSEVAVKLDLATVIRIPAGTDTLALGNPAIADVTRPRAGGYTVVTGKSYGTTNMLALGSDGQILHEMTIHVKAPRDTTLTVQRGLSRETWSCQPRCEPTVTLGDAPDYFGGSSGQIGSRNSLARQ